MRRLIRLVARLYPPWWRRQYAAELDALIDEMTPRLRDVFDLLRGACAMHLTRRFAVPALCTLLGGLAAAALMLAPGDVYSSWATIRIAPGSGDPKDAMRMKFDEAARGVVPPGRVQVMLLFERGSQPTSVRVGITDPDRARAHERAERLVRALAERGLDTLGPPTLPASPDRPFLAAGVAGGSAAGCLTGLILLWIQRRRARIT